MTLPKITMAPNEVQPAVRIVNYFTIVPGSVWGPRAIPDYELILNLEGVFDFTALDTDEHVFLHPGQVLCIMPTERHIHRHLIDYGRHAIISCIHLELHPKFRRRHGSYELMLEPKRIADIGGDPEIPRLFLKANQLYCGNHPRRFDFLRLVAAEIWLRLSEIWERGSTHEDSLRAQAMRKFLEDNWNQPVGRRELAKRFQLTPEHVNAIFRRENGVTPGQYLAALRIHRACRMLSEQGISIKETAEACGYNDEFYFSRVFKKYSGRTPGQIKSHR